MNRSLRSFFRRILRFFQREGRWLMPGLGVKRWILVMLAGNTLIGIGLAILILDFYRNAPESWWLPIVSYLSLRFLTRPLRALIFGSLGLSMILLGLWGFNRSIIRPFLQPGKRVIDTVASFRKLERGPRIVVIGGGTGLSTLLRGLKTRTHNLTAVVTVADDGGSSGELRRSLGVLPPGDIRHCLTALADDETLMSQIFQYRFGAGNGLTGHSLGNLLISALSEITGSFEEGVAESGRVLAVRGKVLPATLHDVRLVADVQIPGTKGSTRIEGESEIPRARGRIRRVWLEPDNPHAYPPAVQAILAADLIVVGPGSLFTSLLPNLLVPDIAEALRVSRAVKFFVCNVATQPGETDGFNCDEHVQAVERHVGGGIFDLVICNSRCDSQLPEGIDWVMPTEKLQETYPLYVADLASSVSNNHHDADKLAQAVIDLYNEQTGPMVHDTASNG
jgi:uncharacterized cofD-like protein